MAFARTGLLCAVLAIGATATAAHAQTVADLQQVPAFVLQKYEKKAAAGDQGAQFRLGLLYERGLVDGAPNDTAAADWYGRAAETGFPPAQFKRARFYAEGRGGPRDMTKAAALYAAAAEQGLPEAQYNYAILLQDGIGVDKNLPEAIRWFEQAAFRGETAAMRALALLYMAGPLGTPHDMIEAWAWLSQSVEAGEADLQAELDAVQAVLSDADREEAEKLLKAYGELRLAQ